MTILSLYQCCWISNSTVMQMWQSIPSWRWTKWCATIACQHTVSVRSAWCIFVPSSRLPCKCCCPLFAFPPVKPARYARHTFTRVSAKLGKTKFREYIFLAPNVVLLSLQRRLLLACRGPLHGFPTIPRQEQMHLVNPSKTQSRQWATTGRKGVYYPPWLTPNMNSG